ncbi:MAG: DUF2071 domain-containing protein [Ilumatobacteraceae bacterium]|nr:DUF2071 domain-containing protein [Ilumatobacteraceae bacterium]
MVQQWRDLAYIHWRYDPAVVQGLLPPGLEVDTFDGAAWVGLIPFSMRGIGVPRLPAVPYFGSFPEINVRTYVRRDGIPGVWFFSLDVNRLIPAVVARTTYLLPYCWGRASNRIDGGVLRSDVERRWPVRARSHTVVRIGEPIDEPDDLSVFLSARWGLYSRGVFGGLMYAPVDHEPWPLQRAELESIDQNVVQAAGLPAPSGDPQVMFSRGVSVRIGRPRRHARRA